MQGNFTIVNAKAKAMVPVNHDSHTFILKATVTAIVNYHCNTFIVKATRMKLFSTWRESDIIGRYKTAIE